MATPGAPSPDQLSRCTAPPPRASGTPRGGGRGQIGGAAYKGRALPRSRRRERRGEMAALPRLLPLLLLLLAASSTALLVINAHSSCPGPLAIPCIPRSYSCHFRSALWACESAHPHAAPGAPAPADGAGPTPRLGVPLPQRGIGRREPERRGPSGLRGRTLAAHTPAERPRNAPGLQLPAEPRAATGPKCTCPSPQPCRPSLQAFQH